MQCPIVPLSLPNLKPVPSCCHDVSTGTPSVLQRLFMGRNKGLKGDGAGMDIRVFPPKARDSRFERSMGDALRQQNEELEMQEVSPSQIFVSNAFNVFTYPNQLEVTNEEAGCAT